MKPPSKTREYRRNYYRNYRKSHPELIRAINHRHYLHTKTLDKASRAKSRQRWNLNHPGRQNLYRRRSRFKNYVLKHADPTALSALQKVLDFIKHSLRDGRKFSIVDLYKQSDWNGGYRVKFIYSDVPLEDRDQRDADLKHIQSWLLKRKSQLKS